MAITCIRDRYFSVIHIVFYFYVYCLSKVILRLFGNVGVQYLFPDKIDQKKKRKEIF